MKSETGASLDIEALGEANKARAYVDAAWLVFHQNRNTKYPFRRDLGIEAGPLLFLCGHATELACKTLLRMSGISSQKIRNFKGFCHTNGHRPREKSHRSHDLVFLFRAVRLLVFSAGDIQICNQVLRDHCYYSEKHQIFEEPPDRPTLCDYQTHLRLLNTGFDRPFKFRYFAQGMQSLPDPELILVMAEHLVEMANSDMLIAKTAANSSRTSTTDQD